MYETTEDVVKFSLNSNFGRGSRVEYSGGEIKEEISIPDSKVEEKNLFQITYSPRMFPWRQAADSRSSASSTRGIGRCAKCLFILLGLGLTFVIAVWVYALVAEGPYELHRNCVILWPIVAGVLIISALFLCLSGYDFFMKRKKERENTKRGSPLGLKASLDIYLRAGEYVGYERHSCVEWSYLCLIFALLCFMIASVEQYFSLDESCYSYLKNDIDDLLLGYEVLAYISVVVLSLLGCFIFLIFVGILVYCGNRNRKLIASSSIS